MARFWVSSGALLTLYVFADDFSASQSRALLRWCVARGADLFTVKVVGTEPALEQCGEKLDGRLAPYAIPTIEFGPIPEAPPGGGWTQPWQLWRLTSESADILWTELKGDLLSYDNSDEAWSEDPVLYRGLDIMLGVPPTRVKAFCVSGRTSSGFLTRPTFRID
jgi:hypothetical protein